MIRFALDANVVSESRRPQPDSEVLRRLSDVAGEAGLPAPVWHELVYGVQRMAPGRRRRALEDFLDELPSRYPVLPYTEAAGGWHAAERARLERIGTPGSYSDGQIAAIAATQDLTVVTRNVKHFRGYRDLRVENWWPDDGDDSSV